MELQALLVVERTCRREIVPGTTFRRHSIDTQSQGDFPGCLPSSVRRALA